MIRKNKSRTIRQKITPQSKSQFLHSQTRMKAKDNKKIIQLKSSTHQITLLMYFNCRISLTVDRQSYHREIIMMVKLTIKATATATTCSIQTSHCGLPWQAPLITQVSWATTIAMAMVNLPIRLLKRRLSHSLIRLSSRNKIRIELY